MSYVWLFTCCLNLSQVLALAPTEGVRKSKDVWSHPWRRLEDRLGDPPSNALPSHIVSLALSSLRFWRDSNLWRLPGPIQPLFSSEINVAKSFGMCNLKKGRDMIITFKLLKQHPREEGQDRVYFSRIRQMSRTLAEGQQFSLRPTKNSNN